LSTGLPSPSTRRLTRDSSPRRRVRQYEVIETFDDGKEFVDTVRDWTETKISRSLAARARRATSPLRIHESVRLRVLRVL
jgi:hypothetical protein